MIKVEQIDQTKGNGVFATCDIQRNQTIFEEYPLISCQFLYNRQFFKACSFCQRSTESVIEMTSRLSGLSPDQLPPLPNIIFNLQEEGLINGAQLIQSKTGWETYCSLDCHDKAIDIYYRVIADHPQSSTVISKLQGLWKSIHFPPESASIDLVIKMVALLVTSYAKNPDLGLIYQFFNSFECRDYQSVSKFIKIVSIEHQLYLQYVDLVNILSNNFPDLQLILKSGDSFKKLLTIMALNAQGLGTSAFEQFQTCLSDQLKSIEDSYIEQEIERYFDQLQVLDTMIEETSGEFTRVEGSALYSLHSKINHSCVPNAQILFLGNDNKVTVKAIRDIKQGEEICISYINGCDQDEEDSEGQDEEEEVEDDDVEMIDIVEDEVIEMTDQVEEEEDRRQILKQFYNFTCHCPKCIEDYEQ